MMDKTISSLRFKLNKNFGSPLIENDVSNETWLTKTSNDDPLTGILMYIYMYLQKEEMHLAKIYFAK